MKDVLVIGAAALGGLAILSNDQGGQQRQNTPTLGGGSGGLVFRKPAPRRQATPAPDITLQAPDPQINTTITPGNTNISGGSDDDGQDTSNNTTTTSTSNNISSTNVTSDTNTSISQGQDDSGDGNPQTDTGFNAADTPGIQSQTSDNITQELNMQQGNNRSMTTRENPNIDLGNGNKNKSSKNRLNNDIDGTEYEDDLQDIRSGRGVF